MPSQSIEVNKITIDDLTQQVIEGNGVFDVLMRSFKNHLEQEYTANRITGAAYAETYVQMVQLAIQQAVAFLLQKDSVYVQTLVNAAQKDLTEEQLALIREQIETERANTLDERTDGTPIVGSVGKQKDLYTQQIKSYQRDAEVKAAKLISDMWNTAKAINEDVPTPNAIGLVPLDDLLDKIKDNNGL